MKKLLPKILIILIFFSFSFLFYRPAYAKPTVAVLWFENRTPDKNLNYLSELIPHLLSLSLQEKDINLLEREQVESPLKEVMLSQSGLVSPQEKIEKGKVEVADFIVSGYFTKKAEKIDLTLRIYNWQDGRSQELKFNFLLSQIEKVLKEVSEELYLKLGQKELLKEVIPPKRATNFKVTLFWNLKKEVFNGRTEEYPFPKIFLEEIEKDLEDCGITCQVKMDNLSWEEMKKISEISKTSHSYFVSFGLSAAPRHCPPTFSSYFYNLTGDSHLKTEGKEFSGSPQEINKIEKEVIEFLLGEFNLKAPQEILERSSPSLESLLYYQNCLKQRLWENYEGAEQEIKKALYLYPDFSFYWYYLAEPEWRRWYHLFNSEIEREKHLNYLTTYLSLSSYKEHPLLYINQLSLFLCFSSPKIEETFRWISIMEEIVYEGDDPFGRKESLAHYLSYLYLLSKDRDIETKLKRLREKEFIPEFQYDDVLCWHFLMEKIPLSFSEGDFNSLITQVFRFGNREWFHYLIEKDFYRMVLKKLSKEEFLNLLKEASILYPEGTLPYALWRSLPEKKFPQKEAREFLKEVEEKRPNSLSGHYSHLLQLQEEFESQKQDNKEELAKEIAKIWLEKLKDVHSANLYRDIDDYIDKILKKNKDYYSGGLLLKAFLPCLPFRYHKEFLSRYLPLLPENHPLHQEYSEALKLLTSEKKPALIPIKKPEKKRHILVSANIENLATVLEQENFKTTFTSSNLTLTDLRNYPLFIFSTSDTFLSFPLLSSFLQNLDNQNLILIIDTNKNLEETEKLLKELNCRLDTKKQLSGDAKLNFHSLFEDFQPYRNIKFTYKHYDESYCSSDLSYQPFFNGYPIYSEGEVLAEAKSYPVMVLLSLPKGKVVLSPNFYHLYETPTSALSWHAHTEPLVERNLILSLIGKLLSVKPSFYSCSLIKKTHIIEWTIISTSLSKYQFVSPFIHWFPEPYYASDFPRWGRESERLIKNERKKMKFICPLCNEILSETSSPFLKGHFLYYLGVANCELGNYDESLNLVKQSQKYLSQPEDLNKSYFTLLRILLKKKPFNREDYQTALSLLEKVKDMPITILDMKARFQEKAGYSKEAIATYEVLEKKILYRFSSISSRVDKILREYSHFRQASLLFQEGNLKKAKEKFLSLLKIMEKDWPPNESDTKWHFWSTSGTLGMTLPCPFNMKAATYLYLMEIGCRQGEDVTDYQSSLKKVLGEAKKRIPAEKELLRMIEETSVSILSSQAKHHHQK